jgi:glycosyltransferase involved in cell wall biosynthesis
MSTENSNWFVIPAHNEQTTIGSVVAPIVATGYSVVVIDDHSTDKTRTVALENGAWAVSHPINLGQGAAIQTGISFALSKNAETIVTFDADGQHQLVDARMMMDEIKSKSVDVVLGSRFLKGKPESMPKMRFMILKLAVLFTRITSRLKVSDTHNGLRVMTAKAASSIYLHQNRMAHASEILSQIRKKGLSFVEFPTDVKYTSYSLGKGQKSSNLISIIFELVMGKFK